MQGTNNRNNSKRNKRNHLILIENLSRRIDELSLKMEKIKFDDYVYFMENPKKMIWPNFLAGLSRGFGIAVGFTLLGALMVYLLQYLITLNLPGISEFIAKIVKLVEFYIRNKG